MVPRPSKQEPTNLDLVKRRLADCRNCPLWEHATQAVPGEGPTPARMLLVGEQPGDREDLAGRPFVGPAGLLLDRALTAAGIGRADVFVTNAVKHFKWEPRGKRRLHSRPNQAEVTACRPWLDAEIALVRPSVIVCLGATATAAILGPGVHVGAARGKALRSSLADCVVVTVHPSAILRAPDDQARHAEMQSFISDLRFAAGKAIPASSRHPAI